MADLANIRRVIKKVLKSRNSRFLVDLYLDKK